MWCWTVFPQNSLSSEWIVLKSVLWPTFTQIPVNVLLSLHCVSPAFVFVTLIGRKQCNIKRKELQVKWLWFASQCTSCHLLTISFLKLLLARFVKVHLLETHPSRFFVLYNGMGKLLLNNKLTLSQLSYYQLR